MRLTAPTQVFFIISLVIALIGILVAANVLSGIPIASVWIMTIAYAVLAGACLIRGV